MVEIENIQRRATRFMCKDPTLSYKERLLELNLLSLNYWLKYLDIVYFFKCKFGLIDLKWNDVFEFCSERSRHGASGVFLKKKRKLKPHSVEIPFW